MYCAAHTRKHARVVLPTLRASVKFFSAETCACSGIAVAVHSAQEVVDPKVRHEQAGKGEDGIQAVVADVPEPRQALVVERKAVDEHGDQGPALLGVPAPVCAP